MLVTSAKELKFIEWPDTSMQNTFQTTNASEMCSVSWRQDNRFMVFIQKHDNPQILALKCPGGIKPVHSITAICKASVAIFQKKIRKMLAIGTESGTVALYDTKTKSITKLFNVPDHVVAMDFNANDYCLGVACANETVTILKVKNGSAICSFRVEGRPISLHFHPYKEFLFGVSGSSGRIYLFNLTGEEPVFESVVGRSSANDFAFSPKNDTLITVGEDYKFCIFDYIEKNCLFKSCLQGPLTSVDFTPDGKYFVIGMDSGCICIYESKDYKAPIHVEKVHSSRIAFVKFSNMMPEDLLMKSSDSVSTIADHVSDRRQFNREDSEFMALYNKYMNKDNEDAEVLRKLKEDIVGDLSKSTIRFHQQIYLQLMNLQEYISKEFDKIGHDLDYKLQLLNGIDNKGDAELSSNEIFGTDDPLVIE